MTTDWPAAQRTQPKHSADTSSPTTPTTRAIRSARRPIIGVTGPDRGGEAAWFFTWLALSLAGASARRITPRNPARLDQLDGLILGGGADVDPQLYGQALAPMLSPADEPRQSIWHRFLDLLFLPLTWLIRQIFARSSDEKQDRRRDSLELALLRQAMQVGKPVLGICRGAQLLNVYFGGSLHRSLAGFYTETRAIRSIRPRKRVHIAERTHLAALIGTGQRWVNSLHRQAVDQLGNGVRVAATEPTGIIQAIEHAPSAFVVGVQWHPEYLPQRREQRAIFQAFVHEARRWIEQRATANPAPSANGKRPGVGPKDHAGALIAVTDPDPISRDR